ncbi:AbiV family abortive infection protein [Candidatus Pantoea deserta]|uniref:AbiV family abortive infection protein n=1 Tax=Candidatus Pantoea deserta TaxID=1869313 RepID=A0A3N4PGT7_9GAMM|nr:AbiV family abortive infection protein [Pantoea deserta]RPE02950.1 AbiV family abortive infection protein [Pantoea deserta]
MEINKDHLKAFIKSQDIKSKGFIGLLSQEEYESVAQHIFKTIKSSLLLYKNDFYSPSYFMSLVAMEEIAKVTIRGIVSPNINLAEVKRSKDPLFDHRSKHAIAFSDVLLIGDRLKKAIGESRLHEIFNDFTSGVASNSRESAIYFSRDESHLRLPENEITPQKSLELLLISMEAYADHYHGMTQIVSEYSDILDVDFDELLLHK